MSMQNDQYDSDGEYYTSDYEDEGERIGGHAKTSIDAREASRIILEQHEADEAEDVSDQEESENEDADSDDDAAIGAEVTADIVKTTEVAEVEEKPAVPQDILKPSKVKDTPMIAKGFMGTMADFFNKEIAVSAAALNGLKSDNGKVTLEVANTTPYAIALNLAGQEGKVKNIGTDVHHQWIVQGNKTEVLKLGKVVPSYKESERTMAELESKVKAHQKLHDAIVGSQLLNERYIVPASVADEWDDDVFDKVLGAKYSNDGLLLEETEEMSPAWFVSRQRTTRLKEDIEEKSKTLEKLKETHDKSHKPVVLKMTVLGAEDVKPEMRQRMLVSGGVTFNFKAE